MGDLLGAKISRPHAEIILLAAVDDATCIVISIVGIFCVPMLTGLLAVRHEFQVIEKASWLPFRLPSQQSTHNTLET